MRIADEVAAKGLRLEALPRYSDRDPRWEVFAPKGFCFIDGTHSRTGFWDAAEVRAWMAEPRAAAIVVCTDPECDSCRPEDEE